MKHAMIPAILAILAVPSTTLAQGWTGIGGSATGAGLGTSPGSGSEPAVILDATNPVVAWTNTQGATRDIYLLRWDGSAWAGLGASDQAGGISGTGHASQPCAVAAADGDLYVAWADGTAGSREIFVKRWNHASSAWEEVGGGSASGGGISATPGDSRSPSIALYGTMYTPGQPAVAWNDGSEIFLRSYDGTAWVEVADSAHAGGISGSDTGVPVDSAPALYAEPYYQEYFVAWSDARSGNAEIYMKRGSSVSGWIEFGDSATNGGVSSTPGASRDPRIGRGDDGLPIIAWADTSNGASQVYIRRYDGTTWNEIGGGSASGPGISAGVKATHPSLSVFADRPVVSWVEEASAPGEIFLRRWDGNAWIQEWGSALGGGISATPGTASQSPAVGVDALGHPMVAWVEGAPGATEVQLRQLSGTTWVELDGSGSWLGLSRSPGQGDAPSLALDAGGHPVVAWSDMRVAGVYTSTEIYVSRWTGTAWEDFGGSASGGGISNSPNDQSKNPSIALDATGRPVVAWEEYVHHPANDMYGALAKTYVKRWNGSAWVGYDDPAGFQSATGRGLSSSTWIIISTAPSLVLDAAGMPVVAWADRQYASSYGPEIYLRRWNGTSWVELTDAISTGTSATSGGVSRSGRVGSDHPVVRIDSAGRIVLAWNEGGAAFLLRWTGTTWEQLDGSASTVENEFGKQDPFGVSQGYGNASVSMALDPDDNPVVVWYRNSGGVRIRRYQGGLWVGMDGQIPATLIGGLGNGPSVAVDAAGNPAVASGGNVYFLRWDPTASGANKWKEQGGSATLGGVSGALGDCKQVQLALDPFGNPTLAWRGVSTASQPQVYLRQWANFAPDVASLRQFKLDGVTAVAAGATSTDDEGFIATASVYDPNGQTVKLQIEAVEVGQAFGVADAPGWTATAESTFVPGDGLATVTCFKPINHHYRWRLRAVDIGGKASAWSDLGTGSLAETDIYLRTNARPVLANAPLQFNGATGEALARGANVTNTFLITFRGTFADDDGDTARLDVECRRSGQAFTGIPTASSALGSTSVTVELTTGEYVWQARPVDEFGKPGDWVAFGPGSGYDVSLIGGSFGTTMNVPCLGSATGAGAGLIVALVFMTLCFKR